LIAPQAVIWTDSAPKWLAIDPALPSFPKAPPVIASPAEEHSDEEPS